MFDLGIAEVGPINDVRFHCRCMMFPGGWVSESEMELHLCPGHTRHIRRLLRDELDWAAWRF